MKTIYRFFLITWTIILLPIAAFSEAAFMPLSELVATSDAIAIIKIVACENIAQLGSDTAPKKGYWRYSQKNRFRFERIIKNPPMPIKLITNTSGEQVLWGGKDFVCASERYSTGKYLIFLKNVGRNEWITINHNLGGLQIGARGNVNHFGYYLEDRDTSSVDIQKVKQIIEKLIVK